MAGDWIKIEVSLPDKPEVGVIAEALDIDSDAVVGKLIRVFSWFDQHTENGNAPRVTEKTIDRISGVTGFADALNLCGWLGRNQREIWLENFERHNGKPAKTRAQTKKRVQRKRNAGAVTKPLPEKRREDKYPPYPPSTRKRSLAHDLSDTSWAQGESDDG
jgi:hypothetical protein